MNMDYAFRDPFENHWDGSDRNILLEVLISSLIENDLSKTALAAFGYAEGIPIK